MRQIPDAETIAMVYNLLHYEGLFVGASSALNMVGAVKTAEAVGKGNTVGEQSVVPIDGCPGRRNSEVLQSEHFVFFVGSREVWRGFFFGAATDIVVDVDIVSCRSCCGLFFHLCVRVSNPNLCPSFLANVLHQCRCCAMGLPGTRAGCSARRG